MPSRWTTKSPMSGYIVAIAATLVVVLLRLALNPFLGDSAYFFPFVIAVTLSAWYGGLNPGLLSTVLGALAAIFFFVPPYYTLTISDPRIATGLVFFLIANVTISFVCNALHNALRRVELSEEALRMNDKRKDAFLAVLAHELRNPLAPMRHSLELLKRSESNPAISQRARTTMERQLSHMVRLVDDLLDLSRINSDKLELQRQPVALSEVVSQAVETVRPLIAEARHELSIDLPTEPLQLNADTVRLSQAFANLLNNACKYTDPGGEISLTAVRENGQVVVSVRDNGMGIPTDLSPKIFDMFTQADHTLERQHGGLGIGLALVKRLVEMHEGEVSAGANPAGRGSEFLVKLPLMAIPKMNESSNSSSANSSTGDQPLRILVVDDNRDSAETLSMLLELMGNEVSVAYDGEQALAMARENKPDVVLLDIGLPKMNGHEVAQQIRKEPWGNNPTLIAITGWGQTEDKELSRESGFDHHLVKPVDHDHLLKLIQQCKSAQT